MRDRFPNAPECGGEIAMFRLGLRERGFPLED
jgi:hypothetical protein